MKKLMLFMLIACVSLSVLSAEVPVTKQYLAQKNKAAFDEKKGLKLKIFTQDNCELKANWTRNGFDFQLIYNEKFPEELISYLNNNNSSKAFSSFYIVFLDDNGFELLKDNCLFNDFKIGRDESGRKAFFNDHLTCDSDIYSRISSVVIDFSK